MFLVVSLVFSSGGHSFLKAMACGVIPRAALDDLGSTFATKHLFVLMYLDPDWLHDRSLLAINELNQISLDYGPWHGEASFVFDNFWLGRWHLQFRTPNSSGRMTHHLFVQVRGASVYLNIEYIEAQRRCSSILLPSPDEHIPAYEIERERYSYDRRRAAGGDHQMS
jgi:hypothetical protein